MFRKKYSAINHTYNLSMISTVSIYTGLIIFTEFQSKFIIFCTWGTYDERMMMTAGNVDRTLNEKKVSTYGLDRELFSMSA